MTQKIMDLCRAMGAGADQEELLLPLVQACEERLRGRLKHGISPDQCSPAFLLAAAMMAMDGLNQVTGGGRVTSFTAGQVSIQTGAADGEPLASAAERMMAPWLREERFAFLGVKG